MFYKKEFKILEILFILFILVRVIVLFCYAKERKRRMKKNSSKKKNTTVIFSNNLGIMKKKKKNRKNSTSLACDYELFQGNLKSKVFKLLNDTEPLSRKSVIN